MAPMCLASSFGVEDVDVGSAMSASACLGFMGVVNEWRRRGLVATFCEARNFAGRYSRVASSAAGDSFIGEDCGAIDLTLSSYADLCAEVLPGAGWPADAPSDYRLQLHVATGELRQRSRNPAGNPADEQAYEVVGSFDPMRRRITWLPSSPWGAAEWVWRAKVDGHSLAVPLVEDPAVLAALDDGAGGLLDFTRHALRPLTFEENEAMMRASHVSGAPSSASPSALVLVGPSCAGKTTVLNSIAGDFGIDPDGAVKRDSMIIHSFHAQYAALVENGRANGGIWLTAWTAIKPHWRKAKAQIFEKACANKRDIIMFARGVKQGRRALEVIGALHGAGYLVHVVGVYASPQDIVGRGLMRELRNGKRYNRENILDAHKIADNFRGFAHSIAQASGRFKVVLNANGMEPQVRLEGLCLNGQGSADDVRSIEDSIAALVHQVMPARRGPSGCWRSRAMYASAPCRSPYSKAVAPLEQRLPDAM